MQVRINLMPYGLQDCSSGSNQSYPSSHSQARDFSLARYIFTRSILSHRSSYLASLKCSLIKRWFSPLFACSPCSRRSSHFSPQHFLKPSLGYAGINLWAFSPSAPATASSLNHFPAGFIGHAVVALLACFFVSPAARRLLSFRGGAGRGGFRCGGLRPAPTLYRGGTFVRY